MRALRMCLPSLLMLALCLLAEAPAADVPVCDLELANRVMKTGTKEQKAFFPRATARLEKIVRARPDVRDAWNRVGIDCVQILDDGLETPERTIHALVELTTNGAVTNDEFAAAVIAVDSLRNVDSFLYLGIISKSGVSDQSTSWLIAARRGNRGHFFEVIGARNLISSGFVNPNGVFGLGIRLRGVEGDLVEELASGGLRFIDFKALNGNYGLDELDRVFRALTADGTEIAEFVFAHEAGTVPPGEWLTKFKQLNEQLIELRKTPMGLRSAGAF